MHLKVIICYSAFVKWLQVSKMRNHLSIILVNFIIIGTALVVCRVTFGKKVASAKNLLYSYDNYL